MSAITVSGLDEQTQLRLREEAHRRGVSVNDLVLEYLRKETQGADAKSLHQVHNELDALAGTWSEDEAREFEAAVAGFEQIDAVLWH